MYSRILIKFSGEQLSGKHEFGVDPEIASFLAEEIKEAKKTGCQIIIVVGGGNMVRGADIAGNGIKRVTADQMGMLSGLMNAMAMTDIFEHEGLPTRCVSNVYAEQLAESFSFRLAEKHLERDRVLIIAGGLGRPYFTHDTAAVSLALEMGCQAVLKGTKVDGVYDKDPEKHANAKKFSKLDYQHAVENGAIKVMDKAALGLAMEQSMPVIVYNATVAGNITKIIEGKVETVGTIVS